VVIDETAETSKVTCLPIKRNVQRKIFPAAPRAAIRLRSLRAPASRPRGYSLQGNPVSPGTSGPRGFYIDQSSVIRYVTSGSATSASSALQ